jgi:hypothetical protein
MTLNRLATAVAALTLLGGTAPIAAQDAPPAPPDTPAANPADVESVDAILAALYDVISGPAGEARDWDRMRSLFTPEARLIPVNRQGAPSQVQPRFLSVEDYIQMAGPFLEEHGFFEREIGRVTERFVNIVHAFSTYDSRWTAEDPEPFSRGINSVQLVWDSERWRIANVMWWGVPPTFEIPEKYRVAP